MTDTQAPQRPDPHPDLGGDFEPFREGLRCFLRSRLNQDSDIDDCIQSVAIKWLQHRHSIPPQTIRAWLFSVAANEAALYWRKQSRQREVYESVANQTDTTSEPVDALVDRETQLQLQRAIESLSPALQEVVRLRLQPDMTFELIAQQLQIPLGTALSRMHRALAQLQKQLHPPH